MGSPRRNPEVPGSNPGAAIPPPSYDDKEPNGIMTVCGQPLIIKHIICVEDFYFVMNKKEGNRKKGGRKAHPMAEENVEILKSIESHIERRLTSSIATNGYKNLNDKVDEALNEILSEIELIIRTQNSWDDVSNLSKIYHSYSSVKFLVSSFLPTLFSLFQKDEFLRSLFYSIIVASGKQYVNSLFISSNSRDPEEIKTTIHFAPFISFLLENVDCQNQDRDVVCRISLRYANKPILEQIVNVISDILSEINISLTRSQISDNGQFAILTLKPK